jgi:hypothetical protein
MAILNISSDILVDVIQNWVGINCISTLDSACCNSTIRFEYLKLLKHECLSLKSPHLKNPFGNVFFEWVSERSVKLSTICLSPDIFRTNKTTFHKINFSNIHELIIDSGFFRSDTDVDYTDIINSCVRIKYLDIDCHTIDDDLVAKIELLHQLEFFRIESRNNQLTPKIIQILAEQCRNLTVVDLCFKSDESYSVDRHNFQTKFCDSLSDLFQQNVNIKKFKLDMLEITQKYNCDEEPRVDSWGFIDIINQTCHNIEECDIIYSGMMNFLHIADFITKNAQLKLLTLTDIGHTYSELESVIIYINDASVKSICCSNFEDPFSYIKDDNMNSGIEHLFCTAESFTEIQLKYILGLSDDFVRLISCGSCATLVSLKIEACDENWSLSAIGTVLTHCKLLTKLSLKYCGHILDADFDELCTSPNILSELVIEDAWQLTTTTLIKLISHSKYLHSFVHDCCPLCDDLLIHDFCMKTLLPNPRVTVRSEYVHVH